MTHLDDVESQKGRGPSPYEEFENPRVQGPQRGKTARILLAAATIVGNSERRVQALGREHDIKVELGVPAKAGPRRPTSGTNSKGAQRATSRSAGKRAGRGAGSGEGAATTAARTARSGTARREATTPGGQKGPVGERNEAGHRPASYGAAARAASGEVAHGETPEARCAPRIHSKVTGQRIPSA